MKRLKPVFIPILLNILLLSGCSFFELPAGKTSWESTTPVSFDPASFWYQPIPAGAAVDPDSATYIGYMTENYANRFVLVIDDGSVPVYEADTARNVSVPIYGSQWSGSKEIAGVTGIPLPESIIPDAGTDGHLALVDREAGVIFDFWQMRLIKGRWVTSICAIADLNGNGVHPEETVRASGFVLPAGMIWPHELQETGSIDHALIFGYPHTLKDTWVSPASGSDGWESEAWSLPMGAHLQLDPDFDYTDPVYGLTGYEKKIAQALQTYGMYLDDTGSVGSIIELEAVNPASWSDNPYTSIFSGAYTDGYVTLNPVLVENLRVLDLPDLQTESTESGQLVHESFYYFYQGQ